MSRMRFDSSDTVRAPFVCLAVTAGIFILFMSYCAFSEVVSGHEVSLVTSSRWAASGAICWSALLGLGWVFRHRLRGLAAGSLNAKFALFAAASMLIAVTDATTVWMTSLFDLCWEANPLLPRIYSFSPRAAMLSAILLLGLLLWERRALAAAGGPAMAAPAAAAPGAWLEFPEAPLLRLRASDVSVIRSAGNYSEVVTAERTYLVRATLSQMADRLGPHGFVRIHRQTVLNATHVRCVDRDIDGRATVRLTRGEVVAVGRRYRGAIDQLTRH